MTEFEEVLETILEEYARRDTEGDFDTWEDTDSFVKEKAEVLLAYANLKKEPVSEDLGEYINELSKQFPEVSFAKLSRIAVRVAKWQKQQDQSIIELAEDHAMLAGMEKMKEEMMEKAVIMEAHEEYGELWGDIRRCNTEKGKRYKVIIIKED